MSAASFLGISGAIALSGYDGFLYSIGFLVAWLVALLLVAEMLRNSGRYTMADQLAYRMRQRPVRTAAATSTVVVSIFYLLAQMVGAGALVALLLGVDSQSLKNLTIFGVGVLMIFYVTVGGMKGTTWVQIVKAVLLMAGSALIVVLVLAKFDFNLSDLLGAAAEQHRQGRGVPRARAEVRRHHDQQDRLPLARHRAGARHRRPAAHPDPLLHGADRAGRPEVGALGDRPDRRLLPDDAGARLRCRGAARHRRPRARSPLAGGNLASPLLAEAVGGGDGSTGGAVLLALIAAVAFATILAVVAGLTLTSASSVAHDLYNSVFKKGTAIREATRSRSPGSPRSCIGADRDRCWRSRRRSSTSRSWWRWPSRSRRRRTCRRSLQHVLAAVQHPRRGLEHLRRPDLLASAW